MEQHIGVFRWITVIVSIIVGLGITRILLGSVAVFRGRHMAKLDWIPLAWAGLVFFQLVAFWWSLEELSGLVPRWTFPVFMLLVGLTLTLFLAAALVLPPSEFSEGDSLRAYFEADGRWALLAIALFQILAILTNLVLWRVSPLSWTGAINALCAILPVAGFLGSRRVLVASTLAQAALLICGAWLSLPAGY